MKRLGLIVLAALVIAGLTRLRFDTDVLNLLPDDLPMVAGLKLYQQNFANRREVLVTIDAETAADAEQTAKLVAARIQTNLNATAVWQPPWLNDSKATAEFIAWLWLSCDPVEVAKLRARLSATNAPAILAETRERLASTLSPLDLARLGHDPFGITLVCNEESQSISQGNELFSNPDGAFRLIYVQPKVEPKNFLEWGVWLDQLRDVLAKNQPTNTHIGLTGSPVFTVETARGMQGDMRQSILFTLLMVAALFWWAHRRFWPLLWMLVMLVSSLLTTMALGGLIFGALNVVSFGFAAILLGLGVDYALVLYQELTAEPHATAAQIRAHAAKGIWWSAGTTALAFALLNFAGLPGLGQLGTLVALGILLAATAMLYGFLPLMTKRPPPGFGVRGAAPLSTSNKILPWSATFVILLLAITFLSRAWPQIDRSADPLGSINSEAARVAKLIDQKMSRSAETDWILIRGQSESQVRQRLEQISGEYKTAEFPLPLWPKTENQQTNLPILRATISDLPKLIASATNAGFNDEAMTLTTQIIASWNSLTNAWPQQPSTRWLIERVSARSGNEWFAMGLLHVPPNTQVPPPKTEGAYIASWSRLAEALLAKVQLRMLWLTAAMIILLIICLRLALKHWTDVLLSFATLAFGFIITLAGMSLLNWKWNLLSLTAIPLLLGASVDYTIHVQLALRRYNGNVTLMRQTIGRALFLVTAAAVAGFGSLALASNAGLASFELVCALGMISIFVTALYLLPGWHYTFTKSKSNG